MKKINVFMASPGDLSEERRFYKEVVEDLNAGFGDGANVEFIAYGWEDQGASTGKRVQELFNEKIDKCDIFILALYMRWGQNAEDAKPYSSYTEEEFYRAYDRFKKDTKPEIYIFYKNVDLEKQKTPDSQLQKVIDFKIKLENTNDVWPNYFKDGTSFQELVHTHLRGFVKRKLKQKSEKLDLPKELVRKVHEQEIELAEDALLFAQEGKIELARTKFAALLSECSNIYILHIAFCFYLGVNDFAAAKLTVDKWLEITGENDQTKEISLAFSNLGRIYEELGEYDNAKKMYEKSLEINSSINDESGLANDYANIGTLNTIKGDLNGAEKSLMKALELSEHNDADSDTSYAIYNSLGNLYLDQLKLDNAETMYQKTLAIANMHDDKAGVAHATGNLGIIYSHKNNYHEALKFLEKSIESHKKMANKRDLARNYGNLANLYQINGKLDLAENMYREAISIEEEQSNQQGLATSYGNFGVFLEEKGKLSDAEQMFRKSLSISDILGLNLDSYRALLNLGDLFEIKKDFSKAIAFYERCLKIAKVLKTDERQNHILEKLEVNYMVTGKFLNAKESIREQIRLNIKKEGVGNISGLHGRLGIVHAMLGEYKMAEDMFKSSIELGSLTGNHKSIKSSYRNLISLHMNYGSYLKAAQLYIRLLFK